MSLNSVYSIAGSALTAQTVRLNTVASNLANADSMASSQANVYKSLKPVFTAVYDQVSGTDALGAAAVKIVDVVEIDRAADRRYEPGNPNADASGFVFYSNVNVVEEMADMMSATRSYETNVEVMNSVKSMQQGLLSLGQSR